MKNALLFCLMIILFASACKKNNDEGAFWTLDGHKYSVTSRSRLNTDYLQAVNNPNDSEKNILRFHFSQLPTTSGEYKITGNLPFVVPTNEVSVEIVTNNSLTHYSSAYNSSKVTVSVAGGKIFVSMPPIWLYKGSNTDSVQVSAQIGGF